jgi:hypothetical protein
VAVTDTGARAGAGLTPRLGRVRCAAATSPGSPPGLIPLSDALCSAPVIAGAGTAGAFYAELTALAPTGFDYVVERKVARAILTPDPWRALPCPALLKVLRGLSGIESR